MTTLELSLLIGAIVTIVAVFATELLRAQIRRSGKLPQPMLLALRITLGVVFLILGVIGSLLPVLQGWVFLLLAVLVLFPQSRFAIKALDKIEPRMPRFVGWLRRRGIGIHRDTSDTIGL